MSPSSLASLPFKEAANLWLDSRNNIDPSTRFNYRCFIKALSAFFGSLTLKEIEPGHVSVYLKQRADGLVPGFRKGGSSCLAHEWSTLKQIMEYVGEWDRIKPWCKPPKKVKSSRGCALTEEQERTLFRVASSRKRWHVAYCCSLITANTTARPNEVRWLRLQDIDFARRTIRVEEGAKNESSRRRLPLNDDAFWAVQQLYTRAAKYGAHLPHHYLLPSGRDPSKPMGSWRKAWERLREAAGMPKLRRYDLRHHAITKLLENPHIPERAVIDLAGHVSNEMLETYSHTRTQALEDAVARIDTGISQKKPYIMRPSPSLKKEPCRTESIPSLPECSPPQPLPTSQGGRAWTACSSTISLKR